MAGFVVSLTGRVLGALQTADVILTSGSLENARDFVLQNERRKSLSATVGPSARPAKDLDPQRVA